MKILVMGTGAVGSLYGGKLARAGHAVTFVARGENLQTLRRRGLTVKSYQGDFHLERVHATDRPADAGVCDLVLVCVKSYDTVAAARLMRPAVGPDTVLLSLIVLSGFMVPHTKVGVNNKEPPCPLVLGKIG